jgi:hypothetical protein
MIVTACATMHFTTPAKLDMAADTDIVGVVIETLLALTVKALGVLIVTPELSILTELPSASLNSIEALESDILPVKPPGVVN